MAISGCRFRIVVMRPMGDSEGESLNLQESDAERHRERERDEKEVLVHRTGTICHIYYIWIYMVYDM